MLTRLLLGAAVIGVVGTRASAPAQQAAGCSLGRGAGSRPAAISIPRAKDVFEEPEKPGTDKSPVLRPVGEIPLPGRPVRFDYQSQDPQSGRLYISHMNDGHVDVVDPRSRRVVGTVAGTPRVTGVLVVPELGKLYASATGQRRVAVIDIASLAERAAAGPIGFPDGLAYAPESRRVFVSDEAGGGELVIDGLTDEIVTRIPLGGEAGNTKYDAGSGCILVAVQTLDQIVAIDPASAIVVARYRPEGAKHPHGLYIDAPERLLFIANQGDATLEVVDLAAMKVTAILKVGEDPDVLAFDPGLHRLYVGTEGDGLWVYRVEEKRLVRESVLKIPHAHTVSVDTATHLVYLPLQNVEGRPVLRVLSASR